MQEMQNKLRLPYLVKPLALATLTAMLAACGGSSNSDPDPTPTLPSTPTSVPAPVADSFEITQVEVATGNVSANDSVEDMTELSYGLDSAPARGSLQFSADGSFVYTPEPGFVGADSFSYMIIKGAESSASVTVTINVLEVSNFLPEATDDSLSVAEDVVLDGDVSSNDVQDFGVGSVSYSVETEPTSGALLLNDDGTFTYTPAADFLGADSFSYTVTEDDGDTASATVTIEVMNVLPEASDDSFSIDENTVLNGDVSSNDIQPDGVNDLSYSVVTEPSSGVLVLNADGTFSYTPSVDYLGDDTFSYIVTETDGDSDTATATVNVKTPDVSTTTNLISNGTFDDVTGWTIVGQNADTPGADMVTIANGVSTIKETVPDTWQHAGLYTSVELEVGIYQFDMDMTYGDDVSDLWGEFYVGAAEPVDGEEYNGELGKVLNAYNAWDCGTAAYSGAATASGCDADMNGQFEITTAGTYYLHFRSGGQQFGTAGVVLDNWSLTKVELPLIANGTFDDATGWTIVGQNADTPGADMVTIANGVATIKESVPDTWQHAGLYTSVELEVGTYQFDMDMTYGDDVSDLWGEFYVGAAEPVDGEEYNGELGKVLNAYNAWDCGTAAYSGAATASGCDADMNGQFEITTVGTYYLHFRSGGQQFGAAGVVLDNWSLTLVE